jgi:hypothetical protein
LAFCPDPFTDEWGMGAVKIIYEKIIKQKNVKIQLPTNLTSAWDGMGMG